MALTGYDGGHGEGLVTTREVWGEIFDLIRHRLPQIPLDDPGRCHLAGFAPRLQGLLGRPTVEIVREGE